MLEVPGFRVDGSGFGFRMIFQGLGIEGSGSRVGVKGLGLG